MRHAALTMRSATGFGCLLTALLFAVAVPGRSVAAAQEQTPPQTGSNSRLRFLPPEQTADQSNAQAATANQPTQQVEAPTTGTSPQGTPQGRPTIGTLRLRGIEAGRATQEQLQANWGAPMQTSQDNSGQLVMEYEFSPFAGAAVTIVNNTVARIALPLSQAMTVSEVAEALQIQDIPQVTIRDEQGHPLGIAFPERGVLLNVASEDANSVLQATVEPVSFHAFLLRAESQWRTNYTGALSDVGIVSEFDPNQPQAHWIRANILNALGRGEEALQSIREASRLVPDTPEYMLTEAAILIQLGHIQLAKDLAAQTVRVSEQLPELRAQAMVFQGDLLRGDGPNGGRQAMDLHMQAIEAAKTMINDPRIAIRNTARDAYLDAHLAIAKDIASGQFRNQAEAAAQWLSRAMVLAESGEESGQTQKKFRVATHSLQALGNMPSPPNPEEWVRHTITHGRALLETTSDPLRKQHISWELATALTAGVKVHRKREEAVDALQLAQLADKYFQEAGPDRGQNGREALQIGLFRFQAGSVEALLNDNHEAAAKWFDVARQNFAQTPKHLTERIDFEYGQILVSMAVSYWDLGQSDAAMQLMTEGTGYMEAAVRGGRLDQKALGAPYYNLAVMHRHLGQEREASQFDELARGVGVDTGAVR